jgi:hypothetical protein
MKLVSRILAVLMVALSSVLVVQLLLRRLYRRWHGREIVLEGRRSWRLS